MAATITPAVTVTTAVPSVSPTQTYTVPASTFVAAGPAGDANTAAASNVTVPAFSVLVHSTAFVYPNVVLGTMVNILPGNSTPIPEELIPWASSLRVVLQGFTAPVPGNSEKTMPAVVSGSATSQLADLTSTSLSANNTSTIGQSIGSATTKGPVKTSNSVSKPSPSGFGGGAVAGVAIGCLVAGALIAFAIAFFCLKRRRNNRHDGASASPASTTIVTDLKGYNAPLPPPPFVHHSPHGEFLPLETSNNQIADDLRALGDLIQAHVQNNYHSETVLVNRNTIIAVLTQLGVQKDGALRPSELASLALAPATRQAALRHVISQVIFTSVDTSARSQLSMLPSPVAAFLQSIPPPDSGSNADVTSVALNKWRVLSAYLLHPARSQRTPLPASGPAISAQTDGVAAALNRFLQYFVPGGDKARAQQTNHLKDIIVECTKLGYTVLSQPSEWRFVHRQGHGGGGHTAVVCAGLVRVTDRDGTPLSSPNEVVAPTIVRV